MDPRAVRVPVDDPDPRRALAESAAFFVATVERVGPNDWERPGLGEWSVRDLAGHTSRSLITIEGYLALRAEAIEAESAVDYFLIALASVGGPSAVARRGREAGAALGDDPVAAIRELADRVLKLAADTDLDRLLPTAVGGMRLRDYLLTRIFELVVHTLDLAAAIGVVVEPPPRPAAISLEIATALALRSGKAAATLLALTGRRPLPVGFSVL